MAGRREIIFPPYTAYQREVDEWLGDSYQTGKIAVLKSVRQSGKTFFCILQLIKMALLHKNTISAIYEPTLNLSRNVYKNFTKALDGSGLIVQANAQTLEVEMSNGSRVLFRSTEQTSRGLTVSGILILDEAAYLDDESIYTILPLINANNAPVIIASTPFIQEGYYYDMFLIGNEGKNPKIKSFDWSRHKEIGRFLTEEQKALYKQTMSRAKYITEVQGDFLTDEGLLFQNMQACIQEPNRNPQYFHIGIDFATGSEGDYTVLSAMDETGRQYALYRTNNLNPTQQVEWLAGLINNLGSTAEIREILAEENSIGKVYIDLLNQKILQPKLMITNWVTTNKSKQDLVTTLQIALENGNVGILNNIVLLNELRKYTAEINPNTKVITYNGKGANDDTVIATMLSYYSFKNKTIGGYNVKFNKPKNKPKRLAEKYG